MKQLKRIKELAEFFYSSNSAQDVPFRIAIVLGQYAGWSLDYGEFIELFVILFNSENLKNDMEEFISKMD